LTLLNVMCQNAVMPQFRQQLRARVFSSSSVQVISRKTWMTIRGMLKYIVQLTRMSHVITLCFNRGKTSIKLLVNNMSHTYTTYKKTLERSLFTVNYVCANLPWRQMLMKTTLCDTKFYTFQFLFECNYYIWK